MVTVDIERISINTLAFRHHYKMVNDLVKDIEKNGLKTPIIVVRIGQKGRFKLIDGYHRLLACKRLKYKMIQVTILEGR